MLSVTPYYNKPNRRGIVRHYEEVAAPRDTPMILYNIPAARRSTCRNDLLAELAQIDHVEAVKQANNDNLRRSTGSAVLRRQRRDPRRACSTSAAPAASASPATSSAPRCAAWSTSPTQRAAIDASLRDVFAALGVTPSPTRNKAALNLLGHDVGGLRLPLVEADEHETATIRAMLAAPRAARAGATA